MAEKDYEIPDWLRELPAEDPITNDDKFGPEDVVWTGEDSELDPVRVLAEHGRDPFPALGMVLRALILGQTPDASQRDVADRLRKALGAVTGRAQTGRPPVDDNDALLEVAWRYHVARYEAPRSGAVELREIVSAVVDEMFSHVPRDRNIERDSYIQKLEDKFNSDRDLLLARATLDDDWGRLDHVKKLKQAFNLLSQLGVQVDLSAIKPRRLKKNEIAARDESS